MNKKKLTAIIAALISLAVIFAFSGCGNDETEESSASSAATHATKQIKTTATDPDSTYTNEDGKTQRELNSSEDNFYGRWVAKSGYAEEIYGNLEITINKDGTFDGNVTGEDFDGTWTKDTDGINITSEYIDGKIYFGKKCRLVIYEDEAESNVVLTKED